jgi:hypothetical protein
VKNLEIATGAASTASVADPKNSAHIGRENTNNPITLTSNQTDQLIANLSPRARQMRRFVTLLSTGEKITSECNQHVLATNLSDIAYKYGQHLRSCGLEIRCRKSRKAVKNRLGEPSGQQYWGLYRLPECALQRVGGGPNARV